MLQFTTRQTANIEFILRVLGIRLGSSIRPSSRTSIKAVCSLGNLQAGIAAVGASMSGVRTTLHTECTKSTTKNERRTSIETTSCSTVATTAARTSASRSSTNGVLGGTCSEVVAVSILHLSSVTATSTCHTRTVTTTASTRTRSATRYNFKLDAGYTIRNCPKVTTTAITGNIVTAVEIKHPADNASGNTRYFCRSDRSIQYGIGSIDLFKSLIISHCFLF
jgi:hypothetical protein